VASAKVGSLDACGGVRPLRHIGNGGRDSHPPHVGFTSALLKGQVGQLGELFHRQKRLRLGVISPWIEGEFHVTREVENEAGDVLRRTYFHGGIDFRRVAFCVEDSDEVARRWCSNGAGERGWSEGDGEFLAPSAAGLIASSTEMLRRSEL
jgi:hypothetical protein